MTSNGPLPSVAIVNASDSLDGVTQSIEPYFDGLVRLGYTTRWYQCLDFHGHPRVPEGGVTVPGFGFPLRTLDMGINRLWSFPRKLRGLPEGIIFLADPTLARVRSPHARVVVHVHDLRPLSPQSDRSSTRMMYRNVLARLRGAWRVIVPSNAVRQELLDLQFDPERVWRIPETHRLGFHPEHVEQSVRWLEERGETRVLFVGTDRPYKNLALVLELARRLENQGDHRYSFTLVSRLRARTRRRVQDLGVGRVRVLSDVESMAPVYAGHDVLVFPSLYEGFGRPLIEAMAFGLPIFANRIAPVEEVVGSGGLLLDAHDPDAWVRALRSLEDPSTLRALAQKSSERGRTYLPEEFDRVLPSVFGPS